MRKNFDYQQMNRIEGSLLGLYIGDAMGAQVEFQAVANIIKRFKDPYTGRYEMDMRDGGTHNLLAGQVTDDSEMAMALIHSMSPESGYSVDKAKESYIDWAYSRAFDMGRTIHDALVNNTLNYESQANGALMRIAPLALAYCDASEETLADLARQDAMITHPNIICQECNVLYCLAIAKLVNGHTNLDVYDYVLDYAITNGFSDEVILVLKEAAYKTHNNFGYKQGWVLIAFQNAFYCLLHCWNLHEVFKSTILRGGDTDTNAAIAGALYGASVGEDEILPEWKRIIKDCHPHMRNDAIVDNPRPKKYCACFYEDHVAKLYEISQKVCELNQLEPSVNQ